MARKGRKKKKRKTRKKSFQRSYVSKFSKLLQTPYLIRDAPIKPFRKAILVTSKEAFRKDEKLVRDWYRRQAKKQKKRQSGHVYDREKTVLENWRVPICRRRRLKRQILFMTGKAGMGKKPLKLRRMTDFSRVKC